MITKKCALAWYFSMWPLVWNEIAPFCAFHTFIVTLVSMTLWDIIRIKYSQHYHVYASLRWIINQKHISRILSRGGRVHSGTYHPHSIKRFKLHSLNTFVGQETNIFFLPNNTCICIHFNKFIYPFITIGTCTIELARTSRKDVLEEKYALHKYVIFCGRYKHSITKVSSVESIHDVHALDSNNNVHVFICSHFETTASVNQCYENVTNMVIPRFRECISNFFVGKSSSSVWHLLLDW